MRSMFSRALRAGAIIVAALSPLLAVPVSAASLPARAEVKAGKSVEPDVFRELVASSYNVQFNRVVAADIDRDGDVDVLAATDHTLTVWVNDGQGHLTRRVPAQPRQFGAGPDAPSLGERDSNSSVSIQTDSHVVDAKSACQRFVPLAQPYFPELSAAAVSVSPVALRPRSPPSPLRLS